MTTARETGIRNQRIGAEQAGFESLAHVYWNYRAPDLYRESLQRKEAEIAEGGALVVETGIHTGRSPNDKFIVVDENTDGKVWWDNNKSMDRTKFSVLWQDFLAHAKGMELFAQDLYGGADKTHRLPTRVFTEYAWHSLFIRILLIRPEAKELLISFLR